MLVLIFFMIILGMLETFFPSGTHFRDLMRADDTATFGHGRERDLEVATGSNSRSLDTHSEIAVLSETLRVVKSKDADGVAWRSAAKGMTLHDRDAVQTLDGATAVISFDPQNRLQLGENSLVVIRRLDNDPVSPGRRLFSMAVDGELSGTLAAHQTEAMQLKLAIPHSTVSLQSPNKTQGPTEFKISVHADDTSTLAILKGTADVLTPSGKQLRIEANQLATITAAGVTTKALRIPTPPSTLSPPDGAVYYYRELPPRLEFQWTAAPTGRYRFTLARDRELKDIVLSKQVDRPELVHGNLKAGHYYWQVTAFTPWAEGAASRVSALQMINDREPPSLDIEFPPAISTSAYQSVHGTTEPGTRLLIAGQPVEVAGDGHFNHEIELASGSNIILVEAIDAAGNNRFRSQWVQGRFP